MTTISGTAYKIKNKIAKSNEAWVNRKPRATKRKRKRHSPKGYDYATFSDLRDILH